MAPDSRRSESCGRLLPPRDSTDRLSCERAMIGMLSSLAIAFSDREIIVAKHRNGAVDTIKLRFRKEQAKFMDYDDLSGEGYSAMDSSMNTEFGSAIGGGAGSLDKINDFGGYGEFGIPSGSGSGPGGLGGTFGAAPPDDEGSPF